MKNLEKNPPEYSSRYTKLFFFIIFFYLRASGAEWDRTVLSEQIPIFDLCTNIKKTSCLPNGSQDPLLIWGETLAAPNTMKENIYPDDETTSS